MRIAGVATREMDGTCKINHPCPTVSGEVGRDRLVRLFGENDVRWLQDGLPQRSKVTGTFDVVLLSAVWMHVSPADRPSSLARIVELTAPVGRIYMTLRFGPGDVERAMWPVSVEEVRRLGVQKGLVVADLGHQPDLLGRDELLGQKLVLQVGRDLHRSS